MTATAGESTLRTTAAFRNVTIENNHFESCSGPNLVISSAAGVVVRGNRFVSAQQDAPPSTGARFGIPKEAVVWISDACTSLSFENNRIENAGPSVGRPVQIPEKIGGTKRFD